MRLKRKLLLFGVSIVLFGVLETTSSYSVARISNLVNARVSTSEEALISVPDNLDLNVKKTIRIVKTLYFPDTSGDESLLEDKLKTEKVKFDEPEGKVSASDYKVSIEQTIEVKEISNNFYIHNNMSDSILVTISVGGSFTKRQNKLPYAIDQGFTVLPGETHSIPFHIEDSIEDECVPVQIYAAWDNGSAVISKTLNVHVETEAIEEVIDLRTPAVLKNDPKDTH
jgi:hypothetical protein